MLPFDEIQSPSPELGLEDDVLPAQQRFPTPKWLRRPSSSSSSSFSSSLKNTLSSTARSLYHTTRTSLLPALANHALPLLRPRLTPRYVLSALFLLYAAHRLLAGRPLLASRLPSYAGAGPYGVGAVDVEVALETPRRVADATFRADGQPAFDVQTVLFTLYYPTLEGGTADSSSSSSSEEVMYWIPKPVSATARGYARFLGVDNALVRGALTLGLWLVAGGITIPARVAAPLVPVDAVVVAPDGTADEEDEKTERGEEGRLPVVVFSHGMLSSRTDYTAYLGSLAARGVVVAALEHRDGSSPGSAVRRRKKEGLHGAAAAAVTEEWRYAFGLRDLTSPAGDLDTPALKEAQLAFREAEIDAAVSVLRGLDAGPVSGPSSPVVLSPESNLRHPTSAPDDLYAAFAGRLDVVGENRITLAGHSYGATGVLRALRPRPRPHPDPDPDHSSFPPASFAGAVALDPGKSSGPLNADVSVPLVVCHSASWSRPGPSLFYGRPHFDVVRDLVEGVNERCGANGSTSSSSPSSAPAAAAEAHRRHRHKEEETDRDHDADDQVTRQEGQEICAPRARGWFFTSLGTSHPSITDAPLLEPLLLAWTTGSTMDAQEGVRQYVHLTRDFVSYQHTGSRGGLLALPGSGGGDEGDDHGDSVVTREYDPSHNERMPERWRPYWQAHVAPD